MLRIRDTPAKVLILALSRVTGSKAISVLLRNPRYRHIVSSFIKQGLILWCERLKGNKLTLTSDEKGLISLS